MHYDIAFKSFLVYSDKDFLKEILKEDFQELIGIEELPQETVSVRSADFPVKVTDRNGFEMIHLIEFQSDWDFSKIWSMIQYKARYTLKYKKRVIFTIVRLRQNNNAMGFLTEEEISFRFTLIKIWELPARKYLDKGVMLPFIPVMEGGLSLTNDAERLIYSSGDEHKADNLTILTMLAELRDPELPLDLIKRRRDIMIQSPVYDLILQEGIEQGLERGSYLKACETADDGIRIKIHENEA